MLILIKYSIEIIRNFLCVTMTNAKIKNAVVKIVNVIKKINVVD